MSLAISNFEYFYFCQSSIAIYLIIWAILLYFNISKWWHNAIPYEYLTDFPEHFHYMVIEADIVNVQDGDGFTFEHLPLFCMPNKLRNKGGKIEARLAGIDAPEMGTEGRCPQEVAIESKYYLESLILHKKVFLKVVGLDKYRRVLVYAFVNSILVNVEMIKMGYAEIYRQKNAIYDSYIWMLENAENYAKKRKNGIWAVKNFKSPAEYKRRLRGKTKE